MVAWVMKDYIGGFRWGRMKEAYKSGGWWTPIYCMTILPLVCGMYEEGTSALAYIMGCGPIFFSMFAAPLHPSVLPKMMYLCPMGRENRKKYIRASAVTRVGIPVLLGSIGVGVLLALGICDWICGVGILLNDIAFSLIMGVGINQNGFGKVSEQGQRVMNFDTRVGVWESFGLIIAMILGIVYPVILAWYQPVSLWVKGLLLVIQLLTQVPVTIKHMEFWRPALENAVYYEKCYTIKETNNKVK